MNENYLPEIGFIKLDTVLKHIPVSKTAWFEGIKKGLYPKPVKLGTRSSAWDVVAIRQLITELGGSPSSKKDAEA